MPHDYDRQIYHLLAYRTLGPKRYFIYVAIGVVIAICFLTYVASFVSENTTREGGTVQEQTARMEAIERADQAAHLSFSKCTPQPAAHNRWPLTC